MSENFKPEWVPYRSPTQRNADETYYQYKEGRYVKSDCLCVVFDKGGWWAGINDMPSKYNIGPYSTFEEAREVAEMPEFRTLIALRKRGLD